MKILQGGFANLEKIIKGVIIASAILILVGAGLGATRVFQVKQERQEIQTINKMLLTGGLTDQVKAQMSIFMQTYPNTRNIIITDKDDNILCSSNYEMIEGKTKFVLERDVTGNGIYGLKGGRDKFQHMGQMDKKMGPGFGIIPNRNQGPRMNDGKMPMNKLENKMPFLNSYKINDNLNIYYISKEFRENTLTNIMMVTGMLMRALFLVLWLLIAVWMYKDSKARGLNAILWGTLGIFTGIFGLVVYLIVRHRVAFCGQCNYKIDDAVNYCPKCGTIVKKECKSCKKILISSENFCSNCGTKQEE